MNSPQDAANHMQPDIPYLRRLMAEALDAGKPVCIFPPEAADMVREELEIDPAEFAESGFMEAVPEEDEAGPPALIIHFARGEHLSSDLITGSLTIPHAPIGEGSS